MLQHSAGLMRSVDPPQFWMVESGKVSSWVWMREEEKHPGMDCSCLLSDCSTPQHTADGCWAGIDCSPPERDQSEIVERDFMKTICYKANTTMSQKSAGIHRVNTTS